MSDLAAQRRQILDMLAEGKITADEAEQLLTALAGSAAPDKAPPVSVTKSQPKYLRVTVDTTANGSKEGTPSRVNVRIPLKLLRAGVQLTSLIPPHAVSQVNQELAKSGIPLDLGQLKPENIEALVEALDDMTVDVDQPDVKVRLFSE